MQLDRKSWRSKEVSFRHGGWAVTQGKPVCSRTALVAAGKDGVLGHGVCMCCSWHSCQRLCLFYLDSSKGHWAKTSRGAKNMILTLKPYGRDTNTIHLSKWKCSNSCSQIQQLLMHTNTAKYNQSRNVEKKEKNTVIPRGIWARHRNAAFLSRNCSELPYLHQQLQNCEPPALTSERVHF